ncbi:hypothetical protein ACIGO7_35620 [Streptomyces virginiae]|uniref:hypothetical protein n=1 Tax=Streptomyces virginiae TaxID=1961 RepID=UPI00344B4087
MKFFVEIDGETHRLGDCNWVLKNGAGCAVGSLWAGADVASAELAHREFTPLKRDRDRQTRNGYTLELVGREQWKARIMPCIQGSCSHRTAA